MTFQIVLELIYTLTKAVTTTVKLNLDAELCNAVFAISQVLNSSPYFFVSLGIVVMVS